MFYCSDFQIPNWWEYSALPSNDVTTDPDTVSDDLSIALHKGKHTCISHLISHFVSYSHLSHFSCLYFFYGLIFYSQVCVRSLVSLRMEGCHEGRNTGSKKEWHLESCCSSSQEESSWCQSVYTVKLNLDGSLAHLKIRLVAQRVFLGVWSELSGHFLAGCKADVCPDSCLFNCHSSLPLHQLDFKNTFLNGVLNRKFTWATTRFCCSRGQERWACWKSLYEKVWFGQLAFIVQF